ncbi:phytanoyl-CoA dioxygenase family protein [Solitalea lacus]|uniref:phytanoyl-CoA dioxygenase family protein n=1 Tax=Solitalea lacus TaxID=2911172 RepID=UPI001EDBA837|nr:phytanoyl-CoA dioxygenase family protein [Solitalea lacus]UKJ09210.1 phytanoyl-CoA dioxygenase family protein [Solitalea lacus]
MPTNDYNKKFFLADELTAEQLDFFDKYGFIHFKKFISTEKVAATLEAISELENKWITQGLEKVNGIPIKYGEDENGKEIVQRFAFSSLHSQFLHNLLQDPHISLLTKFIGDNARLTENEKDGLVISHYVNTGKSNYTKMGWHTDGLRDLFTQFTLNPMLNVGIYLDDSPIEKGGLRIIPGSHKQSLYQMLFRKRYFLDNDPDKDEFCIIAEAGDLTVHSGRIWHRVALSTLSGEASRRRVMYIPIVQGKYKPRSENSWTPLYHKVQHLVKKHF